MMKRTMKNQLVMILTILLTAAGMAGNALAATITIDTPTDDVYIHSSRPDQNFNHAAAYENMQLIVNNYLSKYNGLLKFDLTDIPDSAVITNMTFHFYVIPSAIDTVFFSRMADDVWEEDTVTWNSYAASFAGETYLGDLSITSAGVWEGFALNLAAWDVSDDLADNGLTLMLSTGDISGIWSSGVSIASKERTDAAGDHFTPYLTVEYTAVPLPPAIWLLGTAMIGLAGIRRKGFRQ